MNRTIHITLLNAFMMLTFIGKADTLNVAFYNVENLFNHKKSVNYNDEEFTAQGAKNWTESKFTKKCHNICTAINLLNSTHQKQDIIGLCEVESDLNLDVLTKNPILKKYGYNHILFHNKDKRGICQALLYDTKKLQILDKKLLLEQNVSLRGILYVKAIFKNKDTINVFVNHFTSRISGQKASESFRIKEAMFLNSEIEKVNGKIIVMGDFNDEMIDKSIRILLSENRVKKTAKRNAKSYFHKNEDYLFDNIFSNLEVVDSLIPFNNKTLLNENSKPKRSFQYHFFNPDGFSDHLAVFVSFKI